MIPDDISNPTATPQVNDDTITLPGSHNVQKKRIIDDDGSEAVGGHMQSLDTDDDALAADKQVGFNVAVGDDSQARPLNMAEDVNRAEGDRMLNDD